MGLGGRRMRAILNGFFNVPWTGCKWNAVFKDAPPNSTICNYLDLWDWDGTLERIHRTH